MRSLVVRQLDRADAVGGDPRGHLDERGREGVESDCRGLVSLPDAPVGDQDADRRVVVLQVVHRSALERPIVRCARCDEADAERVSGAEAEQVDIDAVNLGLGQPPEARRSGKRDPGARVRLVEGLLLGGGRRRSGSALKPGREPGERVADCTAERRRKRHRNEHCDSAGQQEQSTRSARWPRAPQHVVPVAVTGRLRGVVVECADDGGRELELAHDLTPSIASRSDLWAAASVAETVPVSISSTSPIVP